MVGFSVLYGFAELNLSTAKEIVENALGILLEPHESGYRGGAYYRWTENGTEIILQRNFDCLDNDLAEPEFPTATILMYLDGKQSVKTLSERIESHACRVERLRFTTYD